MLEILYSVFTKNWKTQSADELGELVKKFGFDGMEYCLRDGYQVEPSKADAELPVLAKKMESYGLKITSVASSLDEIIFRGCAEAGVPVIRTMAVLDPQKGYREAYEAAKGKLLQAAKLCEKYHVKVGVQIHCGYCVNTSAGILKLVEECGSEYIRAVWDAAHSGIAGEIPEYSLEMLWDYIAFVNFKNMIWIRKGGPEMEPAEWEWYLTTAKHGMGSWKRAADYLKTKNYTGVINVTGEYSDAANINLHLANDLAYIKELMRKINPT